MSVVKMASEGFVEGKLAGKADKSTTYTKTEIDNIIHALKTGSRQIVQELPASGDPMVIYMVPKSASQTNNVYDEYIWTAAGAWEKIGDTEIDLSGYYTKGETDDLLDDKADKVTNAITGNLAALDANGNLVDSGKDPGDFVQIGVNQQSEAAPLFTVEVPDPSGEPGDTLYTMLFGADGITLNDTWGESVSLDAVAGIEVSDDTNRAEIHPATISVEELDDGSTISTSTIDAQSMETPRIYVGTLWGQNDLGIGDIELSESCFVHTPYDESTGEYAYQAMGSEIMRAGNDYEAGTLGPLLDVNFVDENGTIGYTDSVTGDTTWTTVQYIVSAADGWSGGYPVVDALTVNNSGTLSLQGGSIEFADSDSGTSYYLSSSDMVRIGSLNSGYWVYDGYDPATGDYSEQQIDATDIASIIYAYSYGFVAYGANYVQSGQSSLFSVVDDYGYETVFTGRTVEIGSNGQAYTVVSDFGVTTMSLTLDDGNTPVTLSPSELEQIKTAYTASVNGDTLELSPVISQSQI